MFYKMLKRGGGEGGKGESMLDGVRTIVLKKENQTALCPKENHSSVLLVVSSFSR